MDERVLKKYIKLSKKRGLFTIVNTSGYDIEDVDNWGDTISYAIKDLVNEILKLKRENESLMSEREIFFNTIDKHKKEFEDNQRSSSKRDNYHHIIKRISELESVIVSLQERIRQLEKYQKSRRY